MIQDFNQNWSFWKEGQEGIRVNLPHDAMIYEKRDPATNNGSRTGYYPGGKYFYQKQFTITENMLHKDVRICFEGVYRHATVLVNDIEICSHAYGYTPFEAVISDAIKTGQNTIQVIADNSFTPNSRWYSGSGIICPVNLKVRNKNYIEDINIQTFSIHPVEIEILAKVHGETAPETQSFTAEIYEPKGELVYKGPIGRIVIPKGKVWSETSPNLYQLILRSEEDEVTQTFGIRTLFWSAKTGLLINGIETKLRGCCVHSDNGILGACSFAAAEERKVKLLKEAGYNAVRSSHNPCSESFLEACDKYGIYVLDELYDGWFVPKTYHDSARDFEANWQKDTVAMVKRDRVHPSVIMYSIGNEVTEPVSSQGAEMGRKMVQLVKELDDSRPVTCGINIMLMKWNATFTDQGEYKKEYLPDEEVKDNQGSAFFNAMMLKLGSILGIMVKGKKTNRLIEPFAKHLDIVGFNYGEYRYDEEAEANSSRILLGTESLVSRQWYIWPRVQKYSCLIGDFVWTGIDYIGETDIGQWWYEQQKGLPLLYGAATIDLCGYPDAQLFYQQAVWGILKKPYLGVRPPYLVEQKSVKRNWRMTDVVDSWTWHGWEGRKTIVEVFADASFVVLFINGKKIGQKKIKHYKTAFHVVYEAGSIEAIAYDKNGQELSRNSLKTAGNAEKLDIKCSKESLIADGQDISYLDITVTDKAGNPVSSSEHEISINISPEAGATLAGFGSAAPATNESFVATTHTTYMGRALAAIRAGKIQENIIVTVSSKSMEDVKLVIRNKVKKG